MPSYSYRSRPIPVLPNPSTLPFPGNLIRQCSDCDLGAGCTAPVPGDGNTPAYVMFLGQNPGKQEDAWGKPFIGQAGQQLDYLLMQCGINREDVYITNVVKCLTRNNAPPKPASVKACAKWLNIELGLVQPKIIVAMGAFAIRRMLGDDADTVEHLHGRPIEKDGRIILPCYHPAAGLHDTSTLRFLYDDFQVLRGLLQGKTVDDYTIRDEYPNPDYRVVGGDIVGIAKTLLYTHNMANVAVDVETVNRDTRLWSVQVSSEPGTGLFIPVSSLFKDKFDTRPWGSQVIVHHYLNDVKWLDIPEDNFWDTMCSAYLLGLHQGLKELATRLCGIKMTSYREMARPGQQKLSLQYLTEAVKREWPDPPELEETKWDNKQGRIVTKIKKPWHISRKITKILDDVKENSDVDPYDRWRGIPDGERVCVEKKLGVMPESSLADIKFEDAVQYATRDADATLRVKLKMEQLIHDAGLDFVLRMDTAILPMVREMMDTGMAVDLDHFRNLSIDYDARMRAKSTELANIVGHPFNPSSSKQVAEVVYTELGFKPTHTTPTGLVSTDDQELKKTKHPVAKGIIEYRRLSKMKGTYSDNLVFWSIPDANGVPRVHTTLKTTRTETGRLSSADPMNFQNIPTRNKEGKAIKNGFIAPAGWLLGEGDLGQIEMCVQAHEANCKGLIELFLRGDDPHTVTASKIFGVPYEEAAQSKYRYPTKRANFGIIYMIGALGLSEQIREYISDLELEGEPVDIEPWSEQDCEKFITDWYKLYPEVKDYQMGQAAQARRYGYVHDMFGRRRFVPEVLCPVRNIQESGLRMAANMPIQSGAQGIIKLAMGELWRELPKMGWRDRVRWLLQIHDSLLVEMNGDPDFVKEYLTWMRNIMCGVVKLAVPVKVDFKIGKAWGELAKADLTKPNTRAKVE
jgi:uracil-DNA glycosylase family 4